MVLDRLGVERATDVGHSSGGLVATALAGQRPERVAALALVNTGPSMAAFIAPEAAGGVGPPEWPPTEEQVRRLASTGFSRPGYQVPRELVDDLRAMTRHSSAATMRAAVGDLRQRALPERLTDVGRPLRVIFGEDDRRWRSSSAADYRAVPGADVEWLPGLGHSPILADPPRTAAPLLAFTAAHAARAD